MSYPTADKVISTAKKYVRSSSYGSPNKFSRWYGFGNQVVAWCAVFVYYILAESGGKELMSGCLNKAYCPTILNWAKKKGYFKTTPKKGDLVLFDWDKNKTADHIGFVIKDLGGGYVQTVEGNTSNASNGNGGCVQIRKRHKSYILGYVRLPYGKSKTQNKTPVLSYTAGKNYTLCDNMNVRKGAGTSFAIKKVKDLTSDGKKHVINTRATDNAVLKKGTVVTVQQVKLNGASLWLKIPSGWICGYDSKYTYVR